MELPPAIDPSSTRQMVDRMIAEQGLKVSIGSDFHGDNMPWVKLGQVPLKTRADWDLGEFCLMN